MMHKNDQWWELTLQDASALLHGEDLQRDVEGHRKHAEYRAQHHRSDQLHTNRCAIEVTAPDLTRVVHLKQIKFIS